MTLIVAIACSDGVVLAADSAATDLESGLKQPAIKLKQIRNLPILYGGSGDVGLLQKIDEGLEEFPAQRGTLKSLRKEIKRRVLSELHDSATMFVSYPQPGFNLPPAAILIFTGVLDKQPFILEVERNGGDTLFSTDDFGHFGAIGSGKPLAQAIFRPHLYTDRDLELGTLFAYRIVDDAIELSSSGLALPIHIQTVTLDGVVGSVDDTEMLKLRDSCAAWRNVERDALGRHLAPQTGADDVPDIPLPELPTDEE